MSVTMIWSLLPRRDKFVAPGPLLDRDSHPRLFTELDSIAAALNESLPTEVYLIPDVNAWVLDRGGVMGFGSRRVMGLGLPLLSILTVSEFRAVLTHEFAHYYGGDTRLGPLVFKARKAMILAIENMASIHVIMRHWVAVILYRGVMAVLVGYWKLFFRSTQMISRRQEYRADELACRIAGSRPLGEGLKKINGVGAAFPAFWNSEIMPNLNSGYLLPITAGFSQFIAIPVVAADLEGHLNRVLNENKIDPNDSHPPLRDRLSALNATSDQAIEDSDPAATLFDNLPAEEMRMVAAVEKSLVLKAKQINWDDLPSAIVAKWSQQVRINAAVLGDMNAETLPNDGKTLADLGWKIPDLPGTLVSETQRAIGLLVVALAFTINEAGWTFHAKPGEQYFQAGDQRLEIAELVDELFNKKISREEWRVRCRSLHLPETSFVDLANAALIPSTGRR